MSALADRYDVVDRRAEGMGVLQGEVHRAATDPTGGLRCVDPLLILLVLGAVPLFFVRSVSHNSHQRKRPALTGPCGKDSNEMKKKL